MKKSLIIIFSLFWLIGTARPAMAFSPLAVAGSSATLKDSIALAANDPRVEKLTAFLAQYHSPLTEYAAQFVQAADRYQLDWRLVPAITGVESTFGKRIPVGSYNAYGWSNGQYRFQSWEQSIDYVSRYLKEKYLDRGLKTPQQIGPVYAPPSATWGARVAYFMKQIELSPSLLPSLSLSLTL